MASVGDGPQAIPPTIVQSWVFFFIGLAFELLFFFS